MKEDYLIHYGVSIDDGAPGRGSGRYPKGSGENPYQHEDGFRASIKKLKEAGFSEKEIADQYGYSIQELRDRIAIDKAVSRNIKRDKVLDLYNSGKTNAQIAKELGINESSVRSLLDPIKHERNNRALNTAKMLKKEIDEHGMTDIGSGMANRLGISETALKIACRYLELEGYHMYNVPISQNGTRKTTSMKVIAPPDMTWAQAAKNKSNVNIVNDPYTEDGGRTWENIVPPMPISVNRIYVRYNEDGGTDKDGLIEIRRNVKDLDLGERHYAQVRIAVSKKDNPKDYKDGSNYMKGVAVYSDDIPEGYDVVYNSNKHRDDDFDDVFKPYKKSKVTKDIDWNNPFKASIKSNQYDDAGNVIREVGQRHYIDENGEKKLSSINIVNEEGDWSKWSKSLSAQFLSKQRPEFAKKQLTLAYDTKKRELDDILALENPEIKMKLLDSFADDCDSAASHLKASPVFKQQSHVILPVESLRDNECYAPNYPNGSIVSLVRHPHGGIFEIPTLIVNNNNKEARAMMGTMSPDAIGINHKVAAQLSGADFDGDTVIVIPNPNRAVVNSTPGLKGLKDFDTKIYKKSPDDVRTGKKERDENGKLVGDGFNTQREMGRITNLITDMTLAAASTDEILRATKYSMVIIDAEKHNLDWKAAEKDLNIQQLRNDYQQGGGVGTLISRAKSQQDVPEKQTFRYSMVDKDTGEVNWKYTNRFIKEFDPETKTYRVPDDKFMSELQQTLKDNGVDILKVNKYSISTYPNDETVSNIIQDFAKQYKKDNGYSYTLATTKSTKMAEVKDAMELSSGTSMEAIYGDYANHIKKLANDARKARINLQPTKYNPEARKTYSAEVSSIMSSINEGLKHKPLERKVQAMADVKIAELMKDHPEFTKEDRKKHRARIVKECRQRMGTQKHRITLTPKEWEAVQNGALSSTSINKLFSLMDVDVVREYATPRNYESKLSKGEIAYAKSLANSGHYTQDEIANFLGISVSTLMKALAKE